MLFPDEPKKNIPTNEDNQFINPGPEDTIYGPGIESQTTRLMAAILRSEGYRAEAIDADAETLALGLKHTGGGECIPYPNVLGAMLNVMEREGVVPEHTIFFLASACGPCRFGQYSKHAMTVFAKRGWQGVRMFSPCMENSYAGLGTETRKRFWHAVVIADTLRKLEHRVRPYEENKGETDAVLARTRQTMERIFAQKDISPAKQALAKCVDALSKIPRTTATKPLIGVVGEIYIRNNPFLNGELCTRIEELGGEVWLTPTGEFVLYSTQLESLLLQEQQLGIKGIFKKIGQWLETHAFFERVERMYAKIADPLLHDRQEHPISEVIERGCTHLPWQFEGEAILTLGRAELFAKKDNVDAIVNVSPMFCMPGTLTSGIFRSMEDELGIPIVCNFYDGSGDPNASLIPVMHYLREKTR